MTLRETIAKCIVSTICCIAAAAVAIFGTTDEINLGWMLLLSGVAVWVA